MICLYSINVNTNDNNNLVLLPIIQKINDNFPK